MKSLLTVSDLSLDQIHEIFDLATFYISSGIERCLEDKVLLSIFFESSTRTRASFAIAAKKLGAIFENISPDNLASQKGEALNDTISTLNALKPDMFIIRHNESGIFHILKNYIDCSIINAGDGMNEHPTQGLIDLFTISRHREINDLNIVICGDLLHGRVAHSDIALFKKFGANLAFVSPATLMPDHLKCYPHFHDISDGIKDADVIILLRAQTERMYGVHIPSNTEYQKFFGLDGEKLRNHAKKDALIMHPGPLNIGVEITNEIATSKNSLILEQVTNGVFLRAAIIKSLLD